MWKCSFAAVPGLSHDRNNPSSCQDVTDALALDDFACICLSDGAGSAVFSRLGANEIINSTINLFKTEFFELYEMAEDLSSKKIIDTCINNINIKYGSKEGFKLYEYSATLLAVAIKNNKCIVVHVGDGIIGAKRGEQLEILSHPWNGEFKNETVFVTSKEAQKHIDLKKFEMNDINGFFMMSDGSQTSFYSSKDKSLISKKGLLQLFEFASIYSARDTSELLEYNLFNLISKNTIDDCSLAIAVKV